MPRKHLVFDTCMPADEKTTSPAVRPRQTRQDANVFMGLCRELVRVRTWAVLCMVTASAVVHASEWPSVQRLLNECVGVYTDLPENVVTHGYTGGPILGNGEIGATCGGTPAMQTIYLNRTDFWARALGGLSITAPVGKDAAQYRYEQDIERGEVRARLTINGNRTEMTGWVAAHEPLFVLKLTNRSTQPVTYTLSPWTKGETNGAVSFYSYQITSPDAETVAVYDAGDCVALGRDDTDRRCWLVEPVAGKKDIFTIRNVQTGHYMVAETGNPKVLCQAVNSPDAPGAQWRAKYRYPGTEYVNVLTGEFIIGDLTNRAVKLGPSSRTSRASVWQFNAVNRPLAPRNAGCGEGVSWAWREYMDDAAGRPPGVSQERRERTGRFAARAVVACRVVDATPVDFVGSLQELKLAPDASATVVVAVDGYGGAVEDVKDVASYCRQAIARVNRQTTETIAKLSGERLDWWQAFWMKSHVDLGDQLLNRYWYGAFYALACCSREGQPCPGLWGAWITTDAPLWHGHYFNNYNFQSPFYGVFSGNHAELAVPFCDTVLQALPVYQPLTADAGYRGVIVPRGWGWPEIAGTPPALREPAATRNRKLLRNDQLDSTMFSAMNFIERYETTLDPAFLRRKLYPVLRACVDFFDDYLVLESGRYILKESAAREGTSDWNAAYPLGYLRRLYGSTLRASRELDRDVDRRTRWQDILERLSDYPTTIVNGKPCFRECESNDRVTLKGPGDNMSFLQFICPGNQVGLESPAAMLETAHNTIAYMNSGRIPSWNQGNNFPQIFTYAARVGWDASDLYRVFRARVAREMRPNLTVCQSGGGIETSGGTEAIHSMLLQTHQGVLHLFPAWPKDKDARYAHLRAHGAFLVSAELKNGIITGLRIVSEKGRDCTIQNPWSGKNVKVSGRETLVGERFTFKTQPNESIELEPE